MRNVVTHAYHRLNYGHVWNTQRRHAGARGGNGSLPWFRLLTGLQTSRRCTRQPTALTPRVHNRAADRFADDPRKVGAHTCPPTLPPRTTLANPLLIHGGEAHGFGRSGRTATRANAQVRGTAAHSTAHGGRADPAYGSEGWGFESLRARCTSSTIRPGSHLRTDLPRRFRRPPAGVPAHQLLTVVVASPVLGALYPRGGCDDGDASTEPIDRGADDECGGRPSHVARGPRILLPRPAASRIPDWATEPSSPFDIYTGVPDRALAFPDASRATMLLRNEMQP